MLGRPIYVRVSRCGQRCLGRETVLVKPEAPVGIVRWSPPDLHASHAGLAQGVSGQSPPAETQPGVRSWSQTKPGNTHELIFRACLLNKESSKPKPSAFAVFSFLRANNDVLVFFLLASKQCCFHPKSLLFQFRADEWSRQGEASTCREDVVGGGREAGGGKETPGSLLTRGLRKLKSPKSFSLNFFMFIEICPPSALSDWQLDSFSSLLAPQGWDAA